MSARGGGRHVTWHAANRCKASAYYTAPQEAASWRQPGPIQMSPAHACNHVRPFATNGYKKSCAVLCCDVHPAQLTCCEEAVCAHGIRLPFTHWYQVIKPCTMQDNPLTADAHRTRHSAAILAESISRQPNPQDPISAWNSLMQNGHIAHVIRGDPCTDR